MMKKVKNRIVISKKELFVNLTKFMLKFQNDSYKMITVVHFHLSSE